MKIVIKNSNLIFAVADTHNLITQIQRDKSYNSADGVLGSFEGFNATNQVSVSPSKTYHLSFGSLTNVKVRMLKWLGDTYVTSTMITAPIDISVDNTFNKIAFNISTGAVPTSFTVLTEEQLNSTRLEENT